jgi:hypothetical protein
MSAQHGLPFLISILQYFFKGAVPQFRNAFRLDSIRIISGISSYIKLLFHHWSVSYLPACLDF